MKFMKPTDMLRRGKELFKEGDEILIISKNSVVGALINSELWQQLSDMGYIEQARRELRKFPKISQQDRHEEKTTEKEEEKKIDMDDDNPFK